MTPEERRQSHAESRERDKDEVRRVAVDFLPLKWSTRLALLTGARMRVTVEIVVRPHLTKCEGRGGMLALDRTKWWRWRR